MLRCKIPLNSLNVGTRTARLWNVQVIFLEEDENSLDMDFQSYAQGEKEKILEKIITFQV